MRAETRGTSRPPGFSHAGSVGQPPPTRSARSGWQPWICRLWPGGGVVEAQHGVAGSRRRRKGGIRTLDMKNIFTLDLTSMTDVSGWFGHQNCQILRPAGRVLQR